MTKLQLNRRHETNQHSTPLLDAVNSKLANSAMNCAGSEDTSAPTLVHTQSPTQSPTKAPTKDATEAPTKAPSVISPSIDTDEPTESVTASLTKPPSDPADKTIIGYYASWQQYDRNGLAKPENMDFTKVDRVNFAFFRQMLMDSSTELTHGEILWYFLDQPTGKVQIIACGMHQV